MIPMPARHQPAAARTMQPIHAEMEHAMRIREQLGCGWTQALLLAANERAIAQPERISLNQCTMPDAKAPPTGAVATRSRNSRTAPWCWTWRRLMTSMSMSKRQMTFSLSSQTR